MQFSSILRLLAPTESAPAQRMALKSPSTTDLLAEGDRIQRSESALEEGRAGDSENSIASMFRQSSHPAALFFLFFFRSAAIATYLLCGFFSDSYVFSTVLVVVLLSADFWTVRNVSGRVLVGLRFWNQVDEDGSSYWVFESRDPSHPVNAVDSKLFWISLYVFPLAWIALLVIGILKFNLSFIPIVILALVFNVANTVGFTYADRDAREKWASGMSASNAFSRFGGVGGTIVGGLVKSGMGKILR